MTSEFGIAVHALVYLNRRGKTLSSEELGKNICTNPARVRKVMAKLKKADLVVTKEGVDGGYLFCRDARLVTLGLVGRAIGAQFVGTAWRSGDIDKECLIASGMADVMDGIYRKLHLLCIAYLDEITIFDIDQKIFGEQQKT